jgi:HK97 family phage major capsid protein
MPEVRDLRQRRGEIVARLKELVERAEAEKRELTAEERTGYDAGWKEQGELKNQIAQRAALAEVERELATSQGTVAARAYQPSGETRQDYQAGGQTTGETFSYRNLKIPVSRPEVRVAVAAWLRSGPSGMAPQEFRALQADLDTVGGFLRPDQEFVARIIQNVDNAVYIRQLATVIPLPSAETLVFPRKTTDASDPTWTSELSIGSADSALAFGRTSITPHPLAKSIRVSNTLLRVSAIAIESYVQEQLAMVFAATQEAAFMTGNGAGQPLGLFTASAQGISTSRDMSTGNAQTAIAADNLRRNKYNLKIQYRNRPSTRWIFNRTVVRDISLLKDGDGQYLWRPGLTGTDPDTIDGTPVLESEYAPNTMTSGLYIGLLGDLAQYTIVDALSMQIQRVVELYAATNETGYIARLECDGKPVVEEAFSRVTLA